MSADWTQLAQLLAHTRKQAKLSREALSGLAGVSVSFIRDAETEPERCSLGLLVQLASSLGLSWQLHEITGQAWPVAVQRE